MARVKLINPLNGTISEVSEERVDSYLKAGYKPVEVEEPKKKAATKKKSTKKKSTASKTKKTTK